MLVLERQTNYLIHLEQELSRSNMVRNRNIAPLRADADVANARVRLRNSILSFAAGYPERWKSTAVPDHPPLWHLVQALAEAVGSDTALARAARLLGVELREQHGYVALEDTDEASNDYLRGLACLATEVLHGPVCTDFGGGDTLTAQQVAFYVIDDWWLGRDDHPIEEWADIRKVREQLMLDALDVPCSKRGDVLGFSARFVQHHPKLIHEARWGLACVGQSESFPDEVWDTIKDDVWRGVYYFAESILATVPNDVML